MLQILTVEFAPFHFPRKVVILPLEIIKLSPLVICFLCCFSLLFQSVRKFVCRLVVGIIYQLSCAHCRRYSDYSSTYRQYCTSGSRRTFGNRRKYTACTCYGFNLVNAFLNACYALYSAAYALDKACCSLYCRTCYDNRFCARYDSFLCSLVGVCDFIRKIAYSSCAFGNLGQ